MRKKPRQIRLAWTHVVGILSNSNIRDLELHTVGENQDVVCQLYLNVHINCVRSHPSLKSQVLIRAAAAQEAVGAEKLTAGTAVKAFQFSLCLSLADSLRLLSARSDDAAVCLPSGFSSK